MYVYLVDNIAYELIPAINPAFPDISIEQRYTAEFLANCVYTDDYVEQGYIYEDGHFHEPEEIIPETEDYNNEMD